MHNMLQVHVGRLLSAGFLLLNAVMKFNYFIRGNERNVKAKCYDTVNLIKC